MRICGLQGVSAIDFPGHISSIVFLGGCNFRCPFCHNPELVLRVDSQPSLEPDDVLATIERRRGLVDGVVVTGGEPLINGGAILSFLERLRHAGLAVKLDTNGYETDTLREVLKERVVDYVAMDVKASPEHYATAVGRTLDVKRIIESINTIRDSGVDHEFRTTCVPGLVELDDIKAIASLLGTGERCVLQQFRASAAVLDPSYATVKSHSPDTLKLFADTARPFVRSVSMRGI